MEEKDAFSDILLEHEKDKKTSKVKKIALIVAFFVLVFIIVISVVKMLNNNQNSDDKTQAIKSESIRPISETRDDPLFKQVPIIKDENKKESFDEWVSRLRNKELQKEREKNELASSESTQEQETESDEVAVKPIKKIEAKPKSKTNKKTKVAEKETKPKQQALPTIPLPKKASAEAAKAGEIYIQVLATSKLEPDKKFLDKIKEKNYPYKLYKTDIKGTTYLKVLIGPFNTRAYAQSSLAKVRQELNPKAFIFTLK